MRGTAPHEPYPVITWEEPAAKHKLDAIEKEFGAGKRELAELSRKGREALA
jgi:hypothetical protein